MVNAYTPGLKVTPRTVVRKTRRLPLVGEVVVGVGQHVTAAQVVARTDLPGKVYPVNVANQLSILPEEVADAMRHREGEAVARDEVLAEARSFFGMFRSEVRSPIDGTVESISRVTGQVILREKPIPVEVTAYIDGTVVEEISREGVIIETEASYVQGIFGLAAEVNAPLAILAESPDQVIDAERIGTEHKGKILIGGAQLTLAALRRCLEVGVAGMVSGGFAYQDMKELLGYDIGVAITGSEKLATTLMITEGFGRIAMARATYELLADNAGKSASMNGATQIRAGVIRPEIVIPRPAHAGRADEATVTGLEVGAPVRCIRAPYFGRIGTVAALPAALTAMPSETLVRVVEVALAEGERIVLPRANVELIERA